MIRLQGRVTTGTGKAQEYVSLPGYARQFHSRLGYEPFPGTLNVALSDQSIRPAVSELSTDIPIDEWEGEERTYGGAVCYPATVMAKDGSWDPSHVLIPERDTLDRCHLELLASEQLRDVLNLDDGDSVMVQFPEALS